MRFSLIIATLGRRDEVKELLSSLVNQEFVDFEVILIDQNTNDMLDEIVTQYKDKLSILHIKSSRKGLSYNRNVGLSFAKGDIVAFPDDDCIYTSTVLKEVDDSFRTHPEYKLRLANVGDPKTKKIYIDGKKGIVKRSELLKYAISFNIFICRKQSMRFDDRLGCGAPYGSGEESDFLFDNMNQDEGGIFVRSVIFHPEGSILYRSKDKLYSYGLGWGALFKKEVFIRKNYLALFKYLYSLVRCVGGLILKRNKSYLYILKGRIKGFITFSIS